MLDTDWAEDKAPPELQQFDFVFLITLRDVDSNIPIEQLVIQWRIQDFPEEGAPTLRGGRQDTILLKFPENCMKLKKIRPPGGGARPLRPPLDPPLSSNNTNDSKQKRFQLKK